MNETTTISAASAADSTARLELVVAGLLARRTRGETLAAKDSELLERLERAQSAERDAQAAFRLFYSTLTPGDPAAGTPAPGALPPDVALALGLWAEASRAWETAAAAYLLSLPESFGTISEVARGVEPARSLIAPVNLPARDALAALFAPHLWRVSPAGNALLASLPSADIRVDFDEVMGFGAERALHQIVRHGAAAAQTFLALIALWMRENPGAPQERYLTVYVSDLLRFQGRKETPRGGYHREDLVARGRDIYFLSRISLPRVQSIRYEDGHKIVTTSSVGRLLSVESLDSVAVDDNGDSEQSFLRFRFHLGREVFEWVGADSDAHAALSARLLNYHPIRQKYQVLLGFCLSHYAHAHPTTSVNFSVPLPELLDLAAIPMPTARLSEFLSSLEDAFDDLARDGVVPGLKLQKPSGWPELLSRRKTRQVIEHSRAVFPAHRALGRGEVGSVPT